MPAGTQGASAAAERLRAALDLHELGVRLYRQRMRREHPHASGADIDELVKAWLAEPAPGDQLRLPPRKQDRGAG
jgi:hypothetical protein